MDKKDTMAKQVCQEYETGHWMPRWFWRNGSLEEWLLSKPLLKRRRKQLREMHGPCDEGEEGAGEGARVRGITASKSA
jgi:hypothetical protein